MIANLRWRLAVWYNQPLPPAWKTGGCTLTVLGSLGYVAVNAWGAGTVLAVLLTIGFLALALTAGKWR